MSQKASEHVGTQDASLDSEMLSTGEVASVLKCSSRTVYRMLARGDIPEPVKIGGLRRWSSRCIEDWIAQGCPSTAS